MNILVISSILPIPGVINNNDFVFQTYIAYRQLFAEDSVVIVRPVKLDLNPIAILKKTSRYSRINKVLTREIHGFQVEIFPFFSAWGFRNVHALITRSIYWLNAKRIKSLFSRYDFAIVHAQYIFPDAQLAYFLHRKYKIPYVVTSHNERFYFKQCISRKSAVKVLKNSSGVFPINHSNYLFYKSIHIPNVELIPLGFNKSFVREQKKSSHDIIRILTVAELITLKNIDKVILAVKNLLQRHNISYTIIGQGPEKDALKNLVDSSGLDKHVIFVDRISHENIAEEMHKYDIFIMPSFFETFGRVYFEAMAMGIPVICAKNSGIYGIFKDGEEGISVDHKQVDEIEKALEYLITDEAARISMGMNGKKLVEQYIWEHIAEKLHEKYATVISA